MGHTEKENMFNDDCGLFEKASEYVFKAKVRYLNV